MKRVISLLLMLCVGCAQRTDLLVLEQDLSLDFECAEFSDNVGRIDDSSKKTYAPATEDQIKDVTYYVFDSKGVCLSRQFDDNFTGNSKINLVGNDVFTIYAIVNCRSYLEFPAAESMTLTAIENMTIPHRESYESLPFAGKASVDLVSNPNTKSLRIKLTRVNSAIRLVNATDDRISLDSYSIDGLPSEGYLFKAGVPPTVTYNATGKPSNDDGDVFSFHIPVSNMQKLSFDINATTIGDDSKEVQTHSSINFSEELGVGQRAEAYVGYLESGSLKVGASDNWGNVGKWKLTDDVTVQVIGGTFNDKGELRAFSGGSEFSFVITSSLGSSSTGLYIDWESYVTDYWAYVNGNVIVVDANTTNNDRKCRVLVKVDGVTKGFFYIVL